MTEPYETDNAVKYAEWLESKNIDYYKFTMAKHFICALEYNDLTGLNDSDINDFEVFTNELNDGDYGEITHFDYKDTENSNFTKDIVSSLMADCVTVFGIIK